MASTSADETKWRRHYKHCLKTCAWRPIKGVLSDGMLLAKAKFTDDGYEIMLTDLETFWIEKLERTSLKKRIQKLNPNIEAPLQKFLDQIKTCLEDAGTEKRLEVDDGGMTLTLTSTMAGLPFCWLFEAESTSSGLGRDHLTLPLVTMVGELSRQKQELFKLLAAKDKQIDDYKSQGAKVTRRHFETTPFDEIAFNNSMVVSKGFEESVRLYEDGLFNHSSRELYRNICTKQAWLSHGQDDLARLQEVEMESGDPGLPAAPSVESWANRIPESVAAGKNHATVSPSKSTSPMKSSPYTSPVKTNSPAKSSSNESTPVKDTELLRRQALGRKLEQEEAKNKAKVKKKKLKL